MNELSKEMIVSEVANILGVTPEAIRKHVRELFPELMQHGVVTYLNNYHVTRIKERMQQTTLVVSSITELDKRETVLKAIQYLTDDIKELKRKIEIDKPKVEFYDEIVDSKDCLDMAAVAKMFNIGRNNLFAILRDSNVLRWNNEPYQQYMQYFKLQFQTWIDTINKEDHIRTKTLVNPKGIDFIRRLLKGLNE